MCDKKGREIKYYQKKKKIIFNFKTTRGIAEWALNVV